MPTLLSPKELLDHLASGQATPESVSQALGLPHRRLPHRLATAA